MKKDRQKLLKWLSNSLLLLGAAVGAVALLNTWQISRTLPPGTCPYTGATRSWLYVAIALLLAAFVLSFFEGPHKPNKPRR